MSRVQLKVESHIEFCMDFSELQDETERAVALILFMNYRLDDGVVYVVDYDTFYRETKKCGISKEGADDALDSLEDRGFVDLFSVGVLLLEDEEHSTSKSEMHLGKTGEIKLGKKKVKPCDTDLQTPKPRRF